MTGANITASIFVLNNIFDRHTECILIQFF